ncbi:unnamed protein product [Hymenolepis diminuta]|uniref:Uncharacterized protein n=1 Tax=Hymenolepis diminuta TaxID=6216 RepID=A0A564XX99_HYMDI|nr:unnamed protein product [Hymenolepis diminuta]
MSLFLTSCFTGNFGKKSSAPIEEYYEFSPAGKVLHRSGNSEQIGADSLYAKSDRYAERLERQRGFKWHRLDDGSMGYQSMWNRISRLLRLEKVDTISNSVQSKASATAENRPSYDGYVNHAFSDLPLEGVANQPPVQVASPAAQIAKFRLDLANVKSDLIQLQEVLSASNATESGITQTVSDYTLSSTLAEENMKNGFSQSSGNNSANDKKLSKSTTNEIESLYRLLKVRTEAMDACLVDNAELRQAVGELTNSLKQLQMENESLRQRLSGNMGPQANNSANGPRNWSFSSESIPNTPCSPPDTTQQTNFRLVNGQPYSTLS